MRRAATVLAALAGFVPLPLPPGVNLDDSSSIAEFAASGNTWVVRVSASSQLQMTTDEGVTWRAVPLGSVQPHAGIAVAPDGSFWVPGRGSDGLKLVHVALDGTVSSIDVDLPPGLMSPPAFDAQKRMWVALSRPETGDKSPTLLARLNPDGKVAQQFEGTLGREAFPFVRFVGSTPYAATEAGTLRLRGSKLELIAGGVDDPPRFLKQDLWPELSAGRSLLTWHALSPDGGRHFVYTDRAQVVVHNSTDLLMRFPFTDQPGPVILRRCSAFVFCDTGIQVPAGVGSLWQTPSGIVAVSAESTAPTGFFAPNDALFSIYRPAVPRQAKTIGKPTGSSRAVMARLNFHRRRAGLPPLVVDARLNAAALAHARYLARHVRRGHLNLSNAHVEKRGAAGFTGKDPQARCESKGTACTNEEVLSGPRPSDVLVSLYYHRNAPMSPYTQYGGAARVGPYTVYEVDTHAQAFVTKPFGYPNGHYDGPLSLQGPELPDPYELCRPFAGNGGYRGVPIVFTTPGREPARPQNLQIQIRVGPDVSVHSTKLYIGKRAVPGCQNNGSFMPKPALRPHTTDTAKAKGRPNPDAPFQVYTWKFRTR
jgi:hypothetical protein